VISAREAGADIAGDPILCRRIRAWVGSGATVGNIKESSPNRFGGPCVALSLSPSATDGTPVRDIDRPLRPPLRRSCCTRATRSHASPRRLHHPAGRLTALGPFTIDLYLPAFPTLQADFRTSAAAIQLTLTGTMIGSHSGS
jgi:hypothetical protein